jgi:REP element-mobilizing transposase RayT
MDNIELEHTTEQDTVEVPEKVKPPRPHRLVPFQQTVEEVSLVEPEIPDTNLHVEENIDEDEDGIVFEPVEQQPYMISYVCLMIPRFDSHLLVGDVVDWLYEWMQQVAVSYGWKLEWLDIQRGHMQWLLSVPVTDPPARFFRVIRHATSARIFEEFPRYRKENMSTDFWAPGNRVVVGRRPCAPEMIDEFTRLTRLQQGITPYQRRR